MHILVENIHGNPNIGLYGFANDSFCLLGKEVPEALARKVEDILHVPTHRITICGTSLIGVFCAGNNKKVLLPEIAFKDELTELDRLHIPYEVIKTKLTALGNNILCNDHAALVNPDYSADVKKRIRLALNVKLRPGTIAGVPTVGSCGAGNRSGLYLHRDIEDDELDMITGVFNVPCETGSVNLGSPYVRSGIICNSNGFVVGDKSGGPEITLIDEALGFIDV